MTPTAPPPGTTTPSIPHTVVQAPPPPATPSRDAIQERIQAKLQAAQAQPDQPPAGQPPATQPSVVATPATPAPPPIVPQPGEGQAAEVPPKPLTVADIDLDSPPKPAEPVVAKPEGITAPIVAPAPQDPTALVAQIAADLGIAPDLLANNPTGRKLLAAQRFRSAIEAPEAEGGIGYLPPAQELVQTYKAAAAMDGLEYELATNPPNALLWALTSAYDPATNRYALRPNALDFIDTMPQTLERLNPALYQRAASPYWSAAADALYAGAQAEVTADGTQLSKEDREAIVNAARIFEKSFLGRDRMAQKKESPELVEARAQLARQQQAQSQAQAQALAARSQAFEGAVFDGGWKALNQDVETILQAMQTQLPDYGKEHLLNEAITRATGDVERGIRPQNPGLFQRFQHSLALHANAARTNTQLDPRPLAESLRRIVQPALRAVAQEVLSQHIEKTQAQNGQLHAQAQAGASRTEPQGGPGTPKASSVLPTGNLDRQPNESQEEYTSRVFRSKMEASARMGQRV